MNLETPTERLKKVGIKNISLQELLIIIINNIEVVNSLVKKYDTLKDLSEASIEDLKKIKGIGDAKASQIVACFELPKRIKEEKMKDAYKVEEESHGIFNPEALVDLLRINITDNYKEHFFVVNLDARSRLINIEPITIGILTASLVHPRETFGSAIKNHATQIIIAHNHPSGEAYPSEEDTRVTRRIFEAGKIMGIELIDHLIITSNGFYSFYKERLIFD